MAVENLVLPPEIRDEIKKNHQELKAFMAMMEAEGYIKNPFLMHDDFILENFPKAREIRVVNTKYGVVRFREMLKRMHIEIVLPHIFEKLEKVFAVDPKIKDILEGELRKKPEDSHILWTFCNELEEACRTSYKSLDDLKGKVIFYEKIWRHLLKLPFEQKKALRNAIFYKNRRRSFVNFRTEELWKVYNRHLRQRWGIVDDRMRQFFADSEEFLKYYKIFHKAYIAARAREITKSLGF